MSEILQVYDLNSNLIGLEERKVYEKRIEEEYRNTSKITSKVKSIRLVLMASNGRMFLQKRSITKNSNPGMIDKSIGGHVSADHSFHLTVIKECAEELGFPAAVLTEDEFTSALGSTDLSTIGIFREVDYLKSYKSKRVRSDGSFIEQPYMTQIFFGYYDGAIKFVDGESSGILTYSLEELEDEIASSPQNFTDDLKFLIENYRDYICPANESEGL